MEYIARRPEFQITDDRAEKLKRPRVHRPVPEKGQGRAEAEGKSLAKSLDSLKSRIPIRAFYSGEEEWKKIRFPAD
jgi:hypothetical protein